MIVSMSEETIGMELPADAPRAVELVRAVRSGDVDTIRWFLAKDPRLARAGLVDRSYLLDPWRRPFHYEPGPKGYLLSAVDEAGRNRPDATIDRRGTR